MSNPILPNFKVEEPKVEIEVKEVSNTSIDEKPVSVDEPPSTELRETEEKPQDEIFVKEEKPKRKRKPMSDIQKEKLKIAREKSLERRRALSEAKKIQKEGEKQLKREKLDAKVAKRLEEDAMIAMKAKMMNEAKANSGWSEEKLVGLMTKTIDSYIEKKKLMKPTAKVHIPNKPMYPQYSPMSQPNTSNYQPQVQPQYMQQNHPVQRHNTSDPYQNLFGFGGQ